MRLRSTSTSVITRNPIPPSTSGSAIRTPENTDGALGFWNPAWIMRRRVAETAAQAKDVIDGLKGLGFEMPGLALTDHGCLFGAWTFHKTARRNAVRPIIGMEAYLTPNTSRFERKRVRWNQGGDDDVSGGGAFTHITLLAENTAGMHNLFRLASR